MDRFTERIDDFQGELDEIAFINPEDPEGHYNMRNIVENSGDERLYRVANRLCDYEDTGLEPDEIPNWILSSEKLPEVGREPTDYESDVGITVLACDEDGLVYEATFWGVSKKFQDRGMSCAPKYWMPLPQPPKEEK